MGQYVALLDILGFKDIINKNTHDDVVRLFEQFRIYVQMGLAKQKSTHDSSGRLIFDVTNSKINSNIVSDSLFFWTNDNNEDDFFELVDILQFFISFCHNLPHIYLRGGITYGDFFYHNNGIIKGQDTLIIHPIMVGKALVEIYETEKKLQIAGCIITEKALREAARMNQKLFDQKWENLITQKKIIEYNVPFKSGYQKHWTINWVRDSTYPDSDEIRQGFASFNKSSDSEDVMEKITNTLNYYSYVKEKYFSS